MKKRTIHLVKKSNYLSRSDVDPPLLLTIKRVDEAELESAKGSELKQVVFFNECEKGLVLNWINAQTIAKVLGSESFDEWPNGRIVLYDDPTIAFAGNLVGGIRIRAARRPTPQVKAEAQPQPGTDVDDYDQWDDAEEVA